MTAPRLSIAVGLLALGMLAGCGNPPAPSPSLALRQAPPSTFAATLLAPPATGKAWMHDGELVPYYVINLEPGPGHCDLGDLLILRFSRDLGQERLSEATALEYLRDPLNRIALGTSALPFMAAGRFEPSVPRPADAIFTGYVNADLMELWRVPGDDNRVYLLRGRTWEQWPLMTEPIRCM